MEKLPVPHAAEETGKDLQVAEEISPEGVDDIQEQALRFFSAVPQLSQEEVDQQLGDLLTILGKVDAINSFRFFGDILPFEISYEEIQSGTSVYAKLYRAIFEFSTTEAYQDPTVMSVTRGLENLIEQNPQMIGPVAMWQLARDYMWRRDIPGERKGSLIRGMTYDITFHDVTQSAEGLLSKLDFENPEHYAESAHLLEALRFFAMHASEEDFTGDARAFSFYVDTLERIQESPNTNYLLFLRSKEMLASFERMYGRYEDDLDEELMSEEVPEGPLFELSKGVFAVPGNMNEPMKIVPEEFLRDAQHMLMEYEENEAKMIPPQVLTDEASEYGYDGVYWTPPKEVFQNRRRLFAEAKSYATLPIEEALGEIVSLDGKEKQELIFDYEYLVSKPMRELISREFGVTLSELTLREQFYFLNYLKGVTVADADAMKQFTAQHGTTGLRTFLSLERGGTELGDQIVAFGQRQEIAERIFAYYGELLDSADSAEHLVQKLTSCAEEDCIQLVEQVRENILNRAQKDLEHAVRIGNISQLEAELDRYNAHAKEYVALLQEIGKGNIETRSSRELTESDKAQMRALMQKNYQAAYPGAAHYDFREAVAASLERGFEGQDTIFRLLRDGDEIVSFNRFDTIKAEDREITYFGSFNAAPAYSGVGGVMLEATLKERLEDGRPMMAHCDPASQIAKKYLEYGFVATHYYLVGGKPSLEIWNSQDISHVLESKNMTKEALLEHVAEDSSIVVRAIQPSEMYDELQQGYGLSRYLVHDDTTYVVFEKLPVDLAAQFVPSQSG